jgi:hypothetical protein
VAESSGDRLRRRLRHLASHPLLWARYVWVRELQHREVAFDVNPRFHDWRPMYRVARPHLARLTGRPAAELDGFFAELAPLHAQLRQEVGALPSAGALIQAPLLYVLARATRPTRAIETGISSGYSARLLLEAMERNGAGHLDSIGIDVFGMTRRPGEAPTALDTRHVGWLVPPALRHRWELHLGTSQEKLPPLLAGRGRDLDLFLHDSLHQYPTMFWEYATAAPALRPGAYLASHDVHANRAWPDFLAREGLTHDEELDHDLGVVRWSDARPTASGTSPTPASG